jgi:type III pantothenate kinase
MLLAIDVGNTNIVFAVFEDGRSESRRQFRLETVRTRPADEYAAIVAQLFQLHGVRLETVREAVVASVVPQVTQCMVALCKTLFTVDALVLGSEAHLARGGFGLVNLYADPVTVGVDRLVNAVAAFEKVRGSCIVIDAGTATTFDCVSATGEFLGGAICPGIQTSADALFARAAKLPKVELAVPPFAIGKSTVQSMQSGIVFGYAGMLEGLIVRSALEIGGSPPPRVIATGGWAKFLAPLIPAIHEVDPDLTLSGLRILALRNRS